MAGLDQGLRPQNLTRDNPDNTNAIVGAEGIRVRQDIDGTQIQRLGVAGADADWGPGEITLAASGDVNNDDEAKIAVPEGVGGTRSSSGVVRSLDSADCSVAYVWTDEGTGFDTLQEYRDDPASIVQEPSALQSDPSHTIQSVNTKSDNCVVVVTNEAAAENQIQFTLNFH